MSLSGAVRGAVSWIWDNKVWIAERLQSLRDWWKGAPDGRGILILGPGGVGKTTLARLLTEDYNPLTNLPGEYTESLSVEHYTLAGDGPEVEIVVPPGQKHRRDATWTELLADVVGGKCRGVVVLGSYGYHSLGKISWKQTAVGKQHGDPASFLTEYLLERREEEIAVLLKLAEALRLNTKQFWLLTVVTKQDLWWQSRAEVERHYRDGRYGKVLEGVIAAHDQKRFRHELVLGSLVISNFRTGVGELLQPNTEGYDHECQARSIRELFQTVDALKNWETGQ